MSILGTLNRIASTLVEMLHTRLELIGVELEEELLRYSSYFFCALIALFFGGISITLLIVFILVLFWDEHRIAALLSLIGLFGFAAAFLAAYLKQQMANKPGLFEQSISELKKDADLFFVGQSQNNEGQS